MKRESQKDGGGGKPQVGGENGRGDFMSSANAKSESGHFAKMEAALDRAVLEWACFPEQ